MKIETALIRWSVVCAQRSDFAAGDMAMLKPFLAGWFMREMGANEPASDALPACGRTSFRQGWNECDTMLAIEEREQQHKDAERRMLYKALVGLVGVNTAEELDQMEAFLNANAPEGTDLVAMLRAITALRHTEHLSE